MTQNPPRFLRRRALRYFCKRGKSRDLIISTGMSEVKSLPLSVILISTSSVLTIITAAAPASEARLTFSQNGTRRLCGFRMHSSMMLPLTAAAFARSVSASKGTASTTGSSAEDQPGGRWPHEAYMPSMVSSPITIGGRSVCAQTKRLA